MFIINIEPVDWAAEKREAVFRQVPKDENNWRGGPIGEGIFEWGRGGRGGEGEGGGDGGGLF